MKEYFSIGEISKLFKLNVRTLRYYDNVGILKPEKVDEHNGYRYYSTKQFERIDTIKYLRMLNVPINKIAAFFDNKDVHVLIEMLKAQQKETHEKILEFQRIEKKIKSRLSQIMDASSSEYMQIRELYMPKRQIVMIQRDIGAEDDLEYPIHELRKIGNLEPVVFLGKVGISILEQNIKIGRFNQYASIFTFIESEDNYSGDKTWLESGNYVIMRFSGTHKESDDYYIQMLKYMEENGYELNGDAIEITLIDSGFTNDISKYVTEIQIPYK